MKVNQILQNPWFLVLNLSFILVLGYVLYQSLYSYQDKEVVTVWDKPHKDPKLDTTSNVLLDRIITPKNYTRQTPDSSSFGFYLQHLPLKDWNQKVRYYNGASKPAAGVYCAVIDLPISPVDLHQCADAVMRLRGEYLFQQKQYNAIHFNFLSDGKPRYFSNYAQGEYSYNKFLNYMDYVFTYANTASLHDELQSVNNLNHIEIGDVFVEKRTPYGHAIIVVDKATQVNGTSLYLLAQSYMPAQETQILINPNNAELSPWYAIDSTTTQIQTPEWTFLPKHHKRF